jgi:outer membrane protein
MRRWFVLPLFALLLPAETATLTLKQVSTLALQQNPDLLQARMDEQRAQLEVAAVAEPILPHIMIGSGLAYTHGMPMSVEGSAPTVVQARAIRSIWDPVRQQQAAQAREQARGLQHATAATREDVLWRVTGLHLDLEKQSRALGVAQRQLASLEKVAGVVSLRAGEGRETALEVKKAELNVARARQRILLLTNARESLGRALALVLGLKAGDTVMPAMEEREEWALPSELQEGQKDAVETNFGIRKLQSDLVAKNFETKSYQASRWPKFDLIAQYGLLAKFNGYDDFFRKFERHNGQVGMSIQVPLFGNASHDARAGQASLDARRIRLQIQDSRNRVSEAVRRAWDKVREAEAARDVARLELDVARQQTSDLLAQMEEGKASLRQVEESRFLEDERWMALLDARTQAERARLEVLHESNRLAAALR